VTQDELVCDFLVGAVEGVASGMCISGNWLMSTVYTKASVSDPPVGNMRLALRGTFGDRCRLLLNLGVDKTHPRKQQRLLKSRAEGRGYNPVHVPFALLDAAYPDWPTLGLRVGDTFKHELPIVPQYGDKTARRTVLYGANERAWLMGREEGGLEPLTPAEVAELYLFGSRWEFESNTFRRRTSALAFGVPEHVVDTLPLATGQYLAIAQPPGGTTWFAHPELHRCCEFGQEGVDGRECWVPVQIFDLDKRRELQLHVTRSIYAYER
jgi:hypothetical protein